jgi:hypothetical protein
MAIKRSQLKSIIKECLIELLAEGLGERNLVEGINNSRQQPVYDQYEQKPASSRDELMRAAMMAQQQSRRQYSAELDTPIGGAPAHPGLSPHARSANHTQVGSQSRGTTRTMVENSIGRLTNDPTMQSIFADTAKANEGVTMNTMPGSSPSSAMQQMTTPQTNVPLDALAMLGGQPNNWAAMAFGDTKKR